MKKIAIFSNDLSVGGLQKSLYNLLNSLDLEKYHIDLYLLKNNNFYNQLPKQINVYYLNYSSKILMLIPFRILQILLKYKGKKEKYDIAIDYDGYQPMTALNCLKCDAKTKIMWIHSDWEMRIKYDKKFKILHAITKSKNKKFNKYVGVSKGVITPFKKVNKLKEIDYKIIPNLINDNEIIKKAKEKCDLKVNKKTYNFCSVGSVVYAKGFDILLDYLKGLTKYRQDFHFYLIGDGPELKNIMSKTKELEIENFVTFLGIQKNPYKYMDQMDGFILTSRYEGQGIVLMEAKILGLEIFMTKNLEKYNEDLQGFENLEEALKKAKKKRKKINHLDMYNKKILNKINSLFNEN